MQPSAAVERRGVGPGVGEQDREREPSKEEPDPVDVLTSSAAQPVRPASPCDLECSCPGSCCDGHTLESSRWAVAQFRAGLTHPPKIAKLMS